jgi:hypothetical protein
VSQEKQAGLKGSQLDLEKRYDIYHCVPHEERLYENVKLVGLRTFEDTSGHVRPFGNYLEIEPSFKVFRSWVEYTS